MEDVTDLATLRIDQVGSLMRPEWLKEAFVAFQEGKGSEEAFKEAADRAVTEVIREQEALDYPILSDGEFRRRNFQDGFADSVTGIERNPSMADPPPGHQRFMYGLAESRFKQIGNQPLQEWRFAQDLTDKPVKITLIAPGQVALRIVPEPAYDNRDDLVADATAVQRRIIAELAEAGCRYIQVDAPSYSEYLDLPRMDERRANGRDPAAEATRDLAADNEAIADAGNATTAIHLCRGNWNDPRFLRTGGYETIAEQAFNTLKHDRFLLEFDNERSGGFEPLRFVPKGKTVVLGLVTTKEADIEDPDLIKRRIDEATEFLPLEQLALSPQCGFSTAIRLGGNPMEFDAQWRKLELVQKVAADVWGGK